MKKPDISKLIRRHLEMDKFFTGDFTVKSEPAAKTPSQHTASVDAAAELEKIAAEVCKCRACGLGSSRTNAVPGEGNPHARIVFVGEAPGADEDAQGRPFVGRAGRYSSVQS